MKEVQAIKNKKAGFEFQLLESFSAGIQLTGTEIKSIRAAKANLSDSYCIFENGELWVKNMHKKQFVEGDVIHRDEIMDGLIKRTERLVMIQVSDVLADKGLAANHERDCILQISAERENRTLGRK